MLRNKNQELNYQPNEGREGIAFDNPVYNMGNSKTEETIYSEAPPYNPAFGEEDSYLNIEQ